jgi:hypothetical protein
MYAHRCQACLRLYKDPKVRDVIAQHHQEKIADVLVTEWLLFHDQSSHNEGLRTPKLHSQATLLTYRALKPERKRPQG